MHNKLLSPTDFWFPQIRLKLWELFNLFIFSNNSTCTTGGWRDDDHQYCIVSIIPNTFITAIGEIKLTVGGVANGLGIDSFSTSAVMQILHWTQSLHDAGCILLRWPLQNELTAMAEYSILTTVCSGQCLASACSGVMWLVSPSLSQHIGRILNGPLASAYLPRTLLKRIVSF